MPELNGRVVGQRRRWGIQDWLILAGGIAIAVFLVWGGFVYVRAIAGG